ncbi:hypothetical protein VTL71DRAFT_12194 [Oculimacula yallundae]|uniref:Uncharacterized protein n=1 Tax=Oculimacula yallundae TaxID=86028 RepID=A0ABR4CSB5_9HELO
MQNTTSQEQSLQSFFEPETMRPTVFQTLTGGVALTTFLSGVSAASGQYIEVVNKCSSDIDMNVSYSAPEGEVGENGPTTILKANGGTLRFDMTESTSHKFHYHNEDHFKGILQLEHNLVKVHPDPAGRGTWYDISLVDAGKGLGPFGKDNVILSASDEKCPVVFCEAGVPCERAYKAWNDHNTKHCSHDTESLTLVFCASGNVISAPAQAPASAKSSSDVPAKAPAPAPVPTPAPAQAHGHVHAYGPAHGPIRGPAPARTCSPNPTCPRVPARVCACKA